MENKKKQGNKMDAMTLYAPSRLVGNVQVISMQQVIASWHAQMESLTTTLEKPAILAKIQAQVALDAKYKSDGHALQQDVPKIQFQLVLNDEYVEYC